MYASYFLLISFNGRCYRILSRKIWLCWWACHPVLDVSSSLLLDQKCCRYNLRCIGMFFATGLSVFWTRRLVLSKLLLTIDVIPGWICHFFLSLVIMTNHKHTSTALFARWCQAVHLGFQLVCLWAWFYFTLFLCCLILLPSLVYSIVVSVCFLVGYLSSVTHLSCVSSLLYPCAKHAQMLQLALHVWFIY